MKTLPPRQSGVALPVMLIMLLTMVITSIYLIKSVNSSTISANNAAYESALVRAADLGLHTGFAWLSTTAATQRANLNASVAASGYVASFNVNLRPTDANFWVGAVTVASGGNTVEYVIHRMCSTVGSFDQINPVRNDCVMTSEADTSPPVLPIGESLIQGSPAFAGAPQVHYTITARLAGARGANVINQMVVLIGV